MGKVQNKKLVMLHMYVRMYVCLHKVCSYFATIFFCIIVLLCNTAHRDMLTDWQHNNEREL
jgi:hypothetical protein